MLRFAGKSHNREAFTLDSAWFDFPPFSTKGLSDALSKYPGVFFLHRVSLVSRIEELVGNDVKREVFSLPEDRFLKMKV